MPLSDSERADLLLMREEERLARDLYRRSHQAWGVPIFGNISDGEQRHHDAIGRLLKRYSVPGVAVDRPSSNASTDLSVQSGPLPGPAARRIYTHRT
ncbi:MULTISPECIES: DUF2202 domain-containing protein [Gordonia]|uniref:DUF2202 domain-containing protein n=2 Tax=Gordoniaceae TaxID=85026 RepID=A0AAE4RAN3_9ACTN|nr:MULTISPECIES: DUF2202 domain-containing protein [Gordonia]ATD69321.1 DUF2202 domain-containing protein [Gordonia sp. 1D]MBA5846049.1 DUF2202 domain-containing protein [Gordonia amicalis]MCZ4581303.1 DUF2202 domain-containing protein [Gordonia amicalis]MDJ0451961.1 DUF2202 domain-containing protein [Gordonia amicalis]MDV6308016.1 DUF2202 domain-containing protein [Gordonia amicalis]